MRTLQNEVRIIGGKWRSRKITFPACEHLRPTPNLVRETLFNWLAPVIDGAVCLDLFAGSGALSFEALSRGAQKTVMVDKSPDVIKNLKKNAELLSADNVEFLCLDFSPNQKNNPFKDQFDIVFLDPPFYQNLVVPCCKWLEENNCLKPEAFIYIEAESTLKNIHFPSNWEIYRQKTTGQVSYYLVRAIS